MIHFSGGYRKRALIFRISALLSCAIFSFSRYIFARLLSQTIDFIDFVGVSLSHPNIIWPVVSVQTNCVRVTIKPV